MTSLFYDMNEMQEKVKRFCIKHDLDHPVEHRLIDIMSELGEVAKDILVETDYGHRGIKDPKNLEEELGDLQYSIITLANALDIDLDFALEKVLEKYEDRIEKGGMGSG